MSTYGKAKRPSSRAMVQQFSMESLTGYPYKKKGTRSIRSNGIGPSPALDQSPVVETVYTTADPTIRAKNPKFVISGNYVQDIPNPKEVFCTSRGEWAFTVKRPNRAHDTFSLKSVGRIFQRAETSVTNLDARYDIEFLGIFLNQGASKGVEGDPNDPLGVVQIRGSHEAPNTGPKRIRVNDYVYAIPAAYSNEETTNDINNIKDANGVAYPSHRSVVQIHGQSVFKLHMQPIPLCSNNTQVVLMNLQKTFRARLDVFFFPDGKMIDHNTAIGAPATSPTSRANIPNIKSDLARVITKARNDHELTNFGYISAFKHWVMIDLCKYAYITCWDLLSERSGDDLVLPTKSGAGEVMQEAYKLLVEACQMLFSEPAMTSSDRSRWGTNLEKNSPIDLSPKLSTTTHWYDTMISTRGNARGKRGWHVLQVADYGLVQCYGNVERFMSAFYAGQAMSEADKGASFTLSIKAQR